jgi:23S rRNA (pseudouridine1915-N3)-methyltransferase
MKIHIVTVGRPHFDFSKLAWEEYWNRLKHFYNIRATHIPDKHNDAAHFEQAIGSAYLVALEITGRQFSSIQLAAFIEKRAQDSRELCFIVGGPEGLPPEIRSKADVAWSFSDLTFPHDLAMVILLEALYRASTINSNTKYHK